MSNDPSNSNFVDWRLFYSSDAFNRIVKQLSSECYNLRNIQNPRPSDKQNAESAVACILVNLFVTHTADTNRYVAMPRSNNYYTIASYYYPKYITRTNMVTHTVDSLRQLGHIDFIQGNFYRDFGIGRVSRIRARQHLISTLSNIINIDLIYYQNSVHTIHMKNKNKERIKPSRRQRATIASYESSLQIINDTLARHHIDLCVTDNKLRELFKVKYSPDAAEDCEQLTPLHLNKKRLIRVFNNDSLKQGGRFYGGWWQGIDKNYRKTRITINGEPTVEVDYDAMHLHMLYHQSGEPYDNDPYQACIDKYPNISRRAGITRKNIKDSFTMLINNPEKPELQGKDKTIEQMLIRTHPIIDRYIGSGIGIKLQYLDSCIAEGVMLELAEQDIPCLPIHDSFMVAYEHRMKLKDAMARCYREVLNMEIAPNKKPYDLETLEEPASPITDTNRHKYQGYLSRMNQ